MKINRVLIFGGLYFFVLAFSFQQTAQATLVIIEDVKTMTQKSDVIIHAQVIDKSVKEDNTGRLVTTTTLKVLDGLKNAKKGDIKTIYQVGGELRGRVMKIAGAHDYRKGEELVLFALKWGDMLVSYGVGLGKFQVLRDKQGVQVVEDLHDLVAVKPGSGQEWDFEEPIPRRYPSLDEFKNAIHTALTAPRFQIILHKPLKRKAEYTEIKKLISLSRSKSGEKA